jgi:hypothetical protein
MQHYAVVRPSMRLRNPLPNERIRPAKCNRTDILLHILSLETTRAVGLFRFWDASNKSVEALHALINPLERSQLLTRNLTI